MVLLNNIYFNEDSMTIKIFIFDHFYTSYLS